MTISLILTSLVFFTPAAMGNMTPIFSARIPFIKKFKKPIDGGIIFRNKPLLGKNKTWRGLLTGVMIGGIISVVLYLTTPLFQNFFTSLSSALIFGIISSFGALSGDAFESFAKRQLDKKPGQPWFPFDQIDYAIGMLSFTIFYFDFNIFFWITTIILWGSISLLTSYIGYFLKIKETPL